MAENNHPPVPERDCFLREKIAVVTGASAGIGQATARALAAQGAKVVLAARREQRLRDLADEINDSSAPGSALPVVTDVEREEDIIRLARAARRELGPIDILVNNAGHGYIAPVAEIDTSRLDSVMRVNFRGAVLCTKHMVGDMVERRSGAIVNILSVSAKHGWATGTPYVASKFALRGFALCLWNEVRSSNVRVINIYPDYVASEFFDVMKVNFSAIDKILATDTIADIILGALRLPENTDVVELEVRPTSLK